MTIRAGDRPPLRHLQMREQRWRRTATLGWAFDDGAAEKHGDAEDPSGLHDGTASLPPLDGSLRLRPKSNVQPWAGKWLALRWFLLCSRSFLI